MELKDFDVDVLAFRQQLGVRRFDVRSAIDHLQSLASSWSVLSTEHLGGIVTVSIDLEASRLDGDVLGKKFSIVYSAIGLVGDCTVEAVVMIPQLVTGESTVLSRFQLTRKGLVFDVAGKQLIDLDKQGNDLVLLVAVLNRVLNASSFD